MKITEVLSIYAAFLSTAVFIWNISRTVPRFRVNIIFGTKDDGGKYEHGIYVIVRNPSSHSIHLSAIEILYPYENFNLIYFIKHIIKCRRFTTNIFWVHTMPVNYGLNVNCPVELEPGKSHEVFVSHRIIEKILQGSIRREIKACAQDQMWRTKCSKKFKYSVYDK